MKSGGRTYLRSLGAPKGSGRPSDCAHLVERRVGHSLDTAYRIEVESSEGPRRAMALVSLDSGHQAEIASIAWSGRGVGGSAGER